MFYTTATEVRTAAKEVLDRADLSGDFRELPYELRQVVDATTASLLDDKDSFPAELGALLWTWDEGPQGAEWLAFKVAMALTRR
jgi:hypothetical protein